MDLITSAFKIIAPLTYWAIITLWSVILIFLLKKITGIWRSAGILKILLIVLALDASRTLFESVYFGAFFNSYFGIFPQSLQRVLQSPILLAIPKLFNIATGLLVLFLIVRRWVPIAEREEADVAQREVKTQIAFTRELQKEKGRLLIAQAVAKVGSWETDLTTLEMSWSPETYKIFEVDPTNFLPTYPKTLELIHSDDRASMDEAFKRSFYDGKVGDFEHRILTTAGEIKFVKERWQTFVDTEGNQRAVGTSQDITELRHFERKAEEASDLLRVASRAAQLGGWAFYVSENRLVWSDETALMHGEKSGFAPTLGEAFNYYAPEYRAKIESAFSKCLNSGTPFDETSRIVTASGKGIWVKSIGVALRDQEGRVTAVRGAIQDISEVVINQENLRLLETAIARLNDVVVITEARPLDEPGPRIVFVNNAFEHQTGYLKEEALGRSPRFLQGEKTDRKELDRIRAATESMVPVRVELINYTKAGRTHWAEIDIAPMIDASGLCTHFVSIQRNISERKELAAKTEEMANRLGTIIQKAPIGIIVHRNFEPIIVNEEAVRMFGYTSRDEIQDLADVSVLFADEDKQRIASYVSASLNNESATSLYSIRGKRRDGSTIEIENREFRVQWGDHLAVCAMLTDVTDQRIMEAQLRQSQRLEAVGQLTGGIAHDFNNLLTVILGNAELLEDNLSGNSGLRLLADAIQKAAGRGAELTSRLLAFSRQQPLSPVNVDINELVDGMHTLLRRTLGEHIDIQIARGVGLWSALIDAAQLENAILNLCLNSRDSMPTGGEITIETRNIEINQISAVKHDELSTGQYVLITVTDAGSGIDASVLPKVFEPFFTTKDVGKGSGLGLSMVYGFVKQSNGHIAIESKLGHGTSIKLYLPKALESRAEKPFPSVISGLPGGSESILLVEDDDPVRQYVEHQLLSLGYQVVSVANGLDAIAALKSKTAFDLIFTDVVMPKGLSGPQLAEIAQTLRPDIPVLFTSGYIEGTLEDQRHSGDSVHVLHKPYRRRELALKIRKVLDQDV